jgi:hypothetical protein
MVVAVADALYARERASTLMVPQTLAGYVSQFKITVNN